jgi:hypothetical protein
MRRHRAILFALYAVGFIALAVAGLFWWPSGETQAYRDCVAIMWDRKHPAEVKHRKEEAKARRCEAEKLRWGYDDDVCPDYGAPPENDEATFCSVSLSLEELRRAE